MPITVCKTPPSFDLSRAVRLIGFARGLSFSDKPTSEAAELAVRYLSDFTTIIWDGDSFSKDSFTYLIVLATEAIKAKSQTATFISFIKESSRERFVSAWSAPALQHGIHIHLVLSPDNLSWDQLALHAMKVTRVKKVVAFGGGEAVLGEVQTSPVKPRLFGFGGKFNNGDIGQALAASGSTEEHEKAVFLVMDVVRVLKGKVETCALLPLLLLQQESK
jgi:hypothetical protein